MATYRFAPPRVIRLLPSAERAHRELTADEVVIEPHTDRFIVYLGGQVVYEGRQPLYWWTNEHDG